MPDQIVDLKRFSVFGTNAGDAGAHRDKQSSQGKREDWTDMTDMMESNEAIVLTRQYFLRPTLTVARDLIGKYLVREDGYGMRAGKIVEVEAYIGTRDKACHAARGRTARTEVMYELPGMAYVYLIYGMYHCLNVVTEREGFPAAVLIRAVEVEGKLIDGPGRLCRALGIDRSLNRLDLTIKKHLWFEDRGTEVPRGEIEQFPRIGVGYAGVWAKKPWRFRLRTERDQKVRNAKLSKAASFG